MSAEGQHGRPRLDLTSYELSLDGRRLKLERQPMELLLFFVQRRGQLVTRSDIVEKLWGKDVLIDVERSINAAVRKIRSVLKDDPSEPKYLETVVGKGYRFIGDVEFVGHLAVPTAPAGAERGASRSNKSVATVLVSLGVVAGLLVAGTMLRWRRQRAASARAQIRSLAVLPLANLSSDPSQEYFADGMTETLTTDLGRIGQLRVISRTSAMHYKNTHETVPEIARDLGVEAVIEGGVARSGDRVRITVQLLQAQPERHLWASTYEGEARDVLALQDKAARSIAQQVEIKLSPQEESALTGTRPIDPTTEDKYYRGRYSLDTWTEDGLETSIGYFKQAVQADPGYAQAWAGLGYAYVLMGTFGYAPRPVANHEAMTAAEKAVELDPSLSDAHVALAVARWPPNLASSMHQAGDAWSSAESELRLAIRLNPNDALAHQTLGYLLVQEGRFPEGINEMKRARELDPLSPNTQHSLGAAYYFAGQLDEALEEFCKVPDPDGNSERRHLFMARVYQQKAMPEQAAHELLTAAGFAGMQRFQSEIERGYRSSGYEAAERRFLRAEIGNNKRSTGKAGLAADSMEIAADYALLGEKERSLEWLRKGFREDARGIAFLKVDNRFESLRADPRFQELLRQIGL